jgi:hypothetical protein
MTPDRAGFGFTKADVTAARKLLAQAGVKKTWDEVDALLCEAQFLADGGGTRYNETMSPISKKWRDRKEYMREKRKRRIAKLREMGVCIICGREYVEPTRATCHPCGVKANLSKKRAG